MSDFNIPEHIINVLRRLEAAGNVAYLVGGCVRDMVTGKTPHDWDIASSAAPEQVASLFEKTVMTGARFGTATVVLPECSVEVTTFRTDGEYHDGRHPMSVAFASDIGDDLSRRDFTMNAMALSRSGELTDPFGGVADIQSRVIRCVGDPDVRFKEDALRMFRAFRFSAQLGFEIEPDTLRAIYANADGARLISAERIRVELEKTLMSARPEIVWDMIDAGLLSALVDTSGCRGDLWSPAGAHCAPLQWTAFAYALGDASILRALRLDAKTIRDCTAGIEILRSGFPDNRADIKRLMARHGADAARCADFAAVDEILRSGECWNLDDLAVSGRDLIARGVPPGKELGAILEKLLDHVIERPNDNEREILLKLALN